jgi:lipoprotein-anchoring transpeptidase ErfK/SrfK
VTLDELQRRRIAPALALAAGIAALTAAAATAAGPPGQVVAELHATHVARSAPTAASRLVETVAARRPITRERTKLPVLDTATDTAGGEWLRVLLPGRPNGHAAWIQKRATTPGVAHWRLVVNVGARRVTAYRDGVAQRSFGAVVGKPSTPTPLGEFFVEEAVAVAPGAVGGPYALALSARSTVFQEFEGGPGQIALHGLQNVGGTPGTAASHGCVRLANAAMQWLVERIGPGVPVTIRA